MGATHKKVIKLYLRIHASHHRRYRVDSDGRVFDLAAPTSAAPALFANVFALVNNFVQQAISTEGQASASEVLDAMDGNEQISLLPLEKAAVEASFAFRSFNDRFIFNPSIELFLACCSKLGLRQGISDIRALALSMREKSQFELADDLIKMIVTNADRTYQVAWGDWRRKFRDRERHMTQVVEELGGVHSKLMVLRLNLFYKGSESTTVTPQWAQRNFARLLNNSRRNYGLFRDLVGYIWNFSFSVEQGFHHQLVLFLSGDSVEGNGAYYADCIGQYWHQQITNKDGAYYNYNAGHRDFDLLGINLVDMSHAESRADLLKMLRSGVVFSDFEMQSKDLRDKACFSARAVSLPPRVPKTNSGRQSNDRKPLPKDDMLTLFGAQVSDGNRGMLQFRRKANRRVRSRKT
jgi:hypothetical protein